MSTATLEAPQTTTTPETAPEAPTSVPGVPAVGSTGGPTTAYVIRGDQVGGFSKGQCVGEFTFPLGTDFDRLILGGVIRPAMSNEIPGTVVSAEAVAAPGISLTQQLTDANETILRLSNRITKQDKEIESLKQARGAMFDPAADIKNQQTMEKYRTTITTMDQQLKSKTDEIEGLRKKLNERQTVKAR